MAEVTLELDDELAAKANRYARAHQTSLDSMLTDYLRELLDNAPEQTDAKKRLMEIIERSNASSVGIKVKREDLYDRGN